MDHPHRAFRWRRLKARSRPDSDGSQDPGPLPRRLPGLFIQIQVTLSLPRQLWWLLVGIAIGHALIPGSLLDKATLLVRALLPG